MKTTLSSLPSCFPRVFAPSWLIAVACLCAARADGIDFDPAAYKPTGDKAKATVVDGKFGKALKLEFADDCKGAFVAGRDRGRPEWDKSAGFSFWVKGDGSDHLGAIEIVWNEDYALRYAVTFPLSSTEWRQVIVPWSDLLPETSKPEAKPIDAKNGAAPSKLGAIWFGKWWYWRDAKAHSYTIDGLKLETSISGPPIVLPPETYNLGPSFVNPPLARVAAKLKAGKPIKIVTMGDSLTDYVHWSNHETNWPTMLKTQLEKKYGSKVTIVNPAIGGTELRQNTIMIPEWAAKHADADLVTINFGGNDWNAGARGPSFESSFNEAVARVRRATGGKADVLIMTTCPQPALWDTMAELAEAGRKAAATSHAGVADIHAAFHTAGAKPADRDPLFAWDHVHLGHAGQELFASSVIAAIEAAETSAKR